MAGPVAGRADDLGPAEDLTMMHEDVVCNRPVAAATTNWMSRYHGEPYYFCSLECRERFELEPEDYLLVEERNPVAPAAMLRMIS
jgi:YHS domain-containing protein